MDNDGTLPLLVIGKLPKECYESWQEFADDFVRVLRLGSDTVAIIQGAAGERGPQGRTGAAGQQGVPGVAGTTPALQTENIPINAGVKFVEFNFFTGWRSAIYTIVYNGAFGSSDVSQPDYVPSSGVVGVGTLVPVYAVGGTTKVRCYFTFAAGVTQTPDANFALQISKF